MRKTCETCTSALRDERGALWCNVLWDCRLPTSVRYLAEEHLAGRKDGKDEDCYAWRSKEDTCERS